MFLKILTALIVTSFLSFFCVRSLPVIRFVVHRALTVFAYLVSWYLTLSVLFGANLFIALLTLVPVLAYLLYEFGKTENFANMKRTWVLVSRLNEIGVPLPRRVLLLTLWDSFWHKG